MKYRTRLTISILIALLILPAIHTSAQEERGRVTDEMLTEFTAYVEDSLVAGIFPEPP